jgi:hypothetical protein
MNTQIGILSYVDLDIYRISWYHERIRFTGAYN